MALPASSTSNLPIDAAHVVRPLVSSVLNMAHAVEEGADATTIFKFMLDGVFVLSEGIGNFIMSIGDEGLGIDNREILDAYFDATLKCKTAALDTLRAASGSLSQLHNLEAALRLMDTKEGINERDAAEAAALNEIKHLDCSHFNLPDALLGDLEAAKNAYEKVIHLCSIQKKKTERVKMIAYVSITGLILLGLMLTPVVVTVPILALDIAVETVVQVAVIAGGVTALVGISSVVAKQIMDLCSLMKALREQWELLNTAQSKAGGLVVGLSQLQVQVESLQIELQNTGEATGFAQRRDNLLWLRDKAFRDDLNKQIHDLTGLKQSARQLTENAVKAFDLFKEKSSVIIHRVTGSYKNKAHSSPSK